MLNPSKKLLSLISCIILLSVVTGLIFHYAKDIYATLTQVKWPIICLLIFLHIPMIALGGLAFKILCTPFKIYLRWQDWAGLSFIANLLNQLFPYRPGMGFRYLYLRQRYKMSNAEFIYVMLVYFLFTLAISAAFTLIGGLTGAIPKSFNHIMLIALALVTLIAFFILWLNIHRPSEKSSLHRLVQKTLHAMHILVNNPAILIGSSISLILANILAALIFYVTFIAIGTPLPFSNCLFLVGIIVIAMIFPITPGNIGVLEALVGTLTQMMYQDFSLGFSVVALYRASQWVPSIVLGSSFSLVLVGTLIPRQKEFKLGTSKVLD